MVLKLHPCVIMADLLPQVLQLRGVLQQTPRSRVRMEADSADTETSVRERSSHQEDLPLLLAVVQLGAALGPRHGSACGWAH